MGLLRDLAVGALRGAVGALEKGDNPFAKKDDKEGNDPKEGNNGGNDFGGPPPPPPPPARDTPEPVIGEGPTLAAPAESLQTGTSRQIAKLEPGVSEPKSLFWDPFAIVDALGYKDKPSPLTYDTLNQMVWRMPILQAIVQTRCKQVANFAKVQQDKYSTGFRVAMRDKKAKATPASEKRSQELERWLLTTGTTDHPAGRDSFSTFLQKFTRDSLTYDQSCCEIVPAKSGKPAEFYAVDARTIRIADTTRLYLDPEDQNVVRYVQIYDGLVVAEYTAPEFIFCIRNPTTNLRNQQYGQSEVEMLVETVTALLWAWEYNQKFFSQGTSAKGILNFKGAVPERQLRSFRSHWYSMTAGVNNSFKVPIVNSDDLQWINMQSTNRDMEYSQWFDFLIKIVAGIYGMDPMEINFKYGDAGAGKSMFESANTSKLAASKDKGLKPMLETFSQHFNQSLIWPHDEDFCLEFVGLETESRGEQADLNTKLVKTIKTVNECRAEEDMPPLPNGLGDIILDPVYMQHLTLAQQTQQQFDTANAAQDNPAFVGSEDDQVDAEPEEGDQESGEADIMGDSPESAPQEKSLRKSQRKIILEVEV